MTKTDIVAVTDAQRGQAGAIVLWRLSGELDFDRLSAAWAREGLEEGLLPTRPSPEVALRRAVREQEGPRLLVRSLPSRAGYALVDVREVQDPDAPLAFDVGLLVRLDGSKTGLEFNGHQHQHRLAGPIGEEFRACLRRIEAEDTGLWLADLVKRVARAVPLRDTGGVYFVPQESVELWGKISACVREASDTFFAEVPAMTSAKAVAAILDAVTREAAGQIEGVEADIQKALAERGGMGARAVRTRLSACAALEAKLATYESLLDTRLEDVRGRLVGLRANLAASALAENAPAEEAA